MEGRLKPELYLTKQNVREIKNAAFNHINEVLPKNLDHNDLQTLLICKGFIEFLGNQNIELPVKIRYEWEKNVKS